MSKPAWHKNPAYEPKTLQQKLGYLVEECGEVMAAAGKSIRWGLSSFNPELPEDEREENQDWLLRELDDLEKAIGYVRAALRRAPVRRFSFQENGLTWNCHECGRVITPDQPRYFDAVSGHIVHHVECHEKAQR